MVASLIKSHHYRILLLLYVLLDMLNLRWPQVSRVKLLRLVEVHLGALVLINEVRSHRGETFDVHEIGDH